MSNFDPEEDKTVPLERRKAPLVAIRWICVFLILGGGSALRFSYISNTLIVDPIRADAANYLVYATNLLDHATFSKDRSVPPSPDAFWAPGYPVFLAGIIGPAEALDADPYPAILIAQLLLGVGTILLCFLIAVSILPGYWPLLPPFLVAISPHLVSMGSYILTETLFGFCMVLSLYTLTQAIKLQRRLIWLLAGASFACTYLVNPVSLFLPPMLALYIKFYNSGEAGSGGWARGAILLVAPLVIVMAAWSIRSALVVPPAQSTASDRLLGNLVIGMYPDYHEKWRANILHPDADIVVPGAGVDRSYGAFFQALAEAFASDPLRMSAWYAVEKPRLLWSWNIRFGFGDIYIYRVKYSLYQTSNVAVASYSLMRSLHAWLVVGSFLGIAYLFVGAQPSSLLPALVYIALLYVSFIYVLSQSEPRFSIPLRPEMYICATYFLWRTVDWFGRARNKGHF